MAIPFPSEMDPEVFTLLEDIGEAFRSDEIGEVAMDFEKPEEGTSEWIIDDDGDERKRAARWAGRRADSIGRNRTRSAWWLQYLIALENMAHLYKVDAEQLHGGGGGCGVTRTSGANWLSSGNSSNDNKCRVIVGAISSRLALREAILVSYPIKHGDLNAKHAADMRNKIVRYLEREKNIHQLKRKLADALPVFGTMFVMWEWDDEAWATNLTPEGQQERGQFGDVKVRLVPPYRMHFPRGIKSLEDADWVIEDQLVPWSLLRRKYPNIAERLNPKRPEFESTGWAGQLGGFDERDIEDYLELFKSGQDIDSMSDSTFGGVWGASSLRLGSWGSKPSEYEEALPFRIHNCYERKVSDEIGEYWVLTRYCCGIELERKPLGPMVVDEDGEAALRAFPDGSPKMYRLPFAVFRYFEAFESFYGKSLIGDLLDLLRAIAVIRTLILKAAVDSTNTYVLQKFNDAITPLVGKVLTFVKYKIEPPKFVKHQNQINELQALVDRLEEALNEAAMMPDVMRGMNPNAGTSGRALEILSETASTGFDNIAARVADGWANVYSGLLELMRWEVEGQRLLPGLGENDFGGALSFKRHDLEGGTDVQAVMESSYSENFVMRRVQVYADLQNGIIDQMEARDIIRGRNNYDFQDDSKQAENMARIVINYVLSMEDQAAEQAYGKIRAAVEQANHDDPSLAPIVKIKARRDALMEFDLAVENWEPIGYQARYLSDWLNSDESRTVHPAKKALVGQKWQVLVDQKRLEVAESGVPPGNVPQQG